MSSKSNLSMQGILSKVTKVLPIFLLLLGSTTSWAHDPLSPNGFNLSNSNTIVVGGLTYTLAPPLYAIHPSINSTQTTDSSVNRSVVSMSTVPEPSQVSLIVLGGAALLAYRFRPRKS